MLDVKVKKLNDQAVLPIYGSEYAAGADLYSVVAAEIAPHTTAKIGTGLAFQPPHGYCALIMARSGLATKQGLRPANCVGLCDEDYTGEYIVALHNDTNETQVVNVGDRVAQVMFVPYEQAKFDVVNELDETARGAGGFGSTGKK